MDIVLNRRGGVPLRDQLVTQIELRILGGAYPPGSRLPSVRALARRLELHPNTVSAAYKDLEAAGHVSVRRGSGIFVKSGATSRFEEARGLDEMIRTALRTAFAKGFSGGEIRTAVERWLAASPPDRIAVVDPSPEMAELMAHEVREALSVPVESHSLECVERDDSVVAGALVVCLPYHAQTLQRLAPSVPIAIVNLELSDEERQAIQALPAGAIVLVVTHSATVVPFASVFLRSLRGDELVIETCLRSDTRAWRRLARVADLLLADALSVAAVRRSRPKRLREARLLTRATLEQLGRGLSALTPGGG